MRTITDLHVHSRYSRATSKDMTLPNMYWWSQSKGIDVIGTGDFTHPGWIKDIEEQLEPSAPGLFSLKKSFKKDLAPFARAHVNDPQFILTVEISCIYSKGGSGRRVHMCICAPSLEAAKELNRRLAEIGNITSDGRPILGLDAKELLKICLDVSPEMLVIPAHAWTPWFAVFGSKSGFDTLEECFDELTPYIPAIETGLSSDPAMNWQLKKLDSISLVSNSDAHSPRKLAREANVFDIAPEKLSYGEIARILRERDTKHFLSTIEFFPEEGKYHLDGHRQCQVSLTPEQSKKKNLLCPKCGRPLTIGVLHRVDDLADRTEGKKPERAVPFTSIVPLEQIIAESFGQNVGTKKVLQEYKRLTTEIDAEFNLLLDYNLKKLSTSTDPMILEGIQKVRTGDIFIQPGYDGVYGVVSVFSPKEKRKGSQKNLFESLE